MLSIPRLAALALLTLPAACSTTHDTTRGAAVVTSLTAANLGSECSAAGPARVIARHAMVPAGIEATAREESLAIGFSVAPLVGVAVGLDPATAMPHAMTVRRLAGTVRHITPRLDPTTLHAEPDAELDGAGMKGGRVVVGDGHLVVGVANGAIAWSEGVNAQPHTLWPLPAHDGRDRVDGLRAVSLGGETSVVVFRQGSALWMGAFSRSGRQGDLLALPTDAPAVGNPALVANGRAVMVSWQEGMTVSWLRWAPGAPVGEARSLTEVPPAASALWPSLARAGSGNVLLVWTEASAERHHVRAQLLADDGAPIGRATMLAKDGDGDIDVLGHASASVGSDGRGVVAFLASDGDLFDVMATPIACSAP